MALRNDQFPPRRRVKSWNLYITKISSNSPSLLAGTSSPTEFCSDFTIPKICTWLINHVGSFAAVTTYGEFPRRVNFAFLGAARRFPAEHLEGDQLSVIGFVRFYQPDLRICPVRDLVEVAWGWVEGRNTTMYNHHQPRPWWSVKWCDPCARI